MPVAPTGLRRLAAGAGIDAHHHDEHQIVYAARGVVSVTTGEGRWIAPGTLAIWVPAGTVHEHRAYGRTELRLVGLPVSANPLGLDGPAVLAVEPLLRELIIEYSGGAGCGPGADVEADAVADDPERARLRAVLLDRLRHSPRHPVRLPTPRDPRLAAVCALLNEDPADGRTLGELGAEIGAGERTLSRLFGAELGMSFPQWRTQLRLHHALILLAGGVPVTVVAHRCGWSSASAFIDVFRAAFGRTPGRSR